jgi:hypothetical protein
MTGAHRNEANRGDERGAALVEFAISLPLLLMLVFGIVSSGLAFSNQLALTHSAREAARYGATLPIDNFTDLHGWLQAIKTRAIDDASGSLDATIPGWTVCVAYVHPDGTLSTDQTTGLRADASGESFGSAPCFADGRPSDERRVQVRVARDMEFGVLLFSMGITLDSEAASRFEAGLGFG